MAKTATVTRIKQPSTIAFPTPQNREQVADYIAAIGIAQRERARLEQDMNDELARSSSSYEEQALPFRTEIEERSKGVQAWCETNRNALTQDGRTKTAVLTSGEVQWRLRPPKVSIKGLDAVLDKLRRMGLDRFIRTKDEVNKEAILAEQEAVKRVAGISIEQGEDFVIKPFETQLEEIAK
jgi:phage host-nuclease inhibitor protein Gam